ncbi:MAG TPA: hypothetical protein VMO81_02995 [Aestuariivirgaceae bacterium]|nr:hypothetical protein [Aestuariivirgaceae bacterium]
MTSISHHASTTLAWLQLRREGLRKAGLAASLVLFLGGLTVALYAVPDLPGRLALAPMALVLVVCVPIQIGLNAAEFRLMTRYGGHDVHWPAAFEISIYTTAANMLPLPGGIVTRLAAMRTYGIRLGKGSAVIALGMGLWGGVAFAYAGTWLMVDGKVAIAAVFLALACLLLVPSVIGSWRLNRGIGLLAQVVLVRLSSMVLDSARMVLAIYALGASINFYEASIFVVSSFLGTVLAIGPAGLGVREFLVAALAPLVGIDPAIAFLSATVNRLMGMTGLAAAAGLLLWLTRRRASQ